MKTDRSSSMHRSGTMPISLPKISKLNVKQSRYNNINLTQNNINQNESQYNNKSSFHINVSKTRKNSKSFMQSKSPFTTRVQHQVLDQNQYPYIQTNNIEKQQSKLKQLLKQFNNQTVTILQKYIIDKPIRKQQVKVKQPVQQMYFRRDKQAQNATNMIQLLKYEIQKLQSRCQNLKYTSKQQFELKIKELKQDKHKIITQNKQISKQITLNGLQMIKGKQSITKQLQYEQYLINTKRDKLSRQSKNVKSQIQSLQSKTKQLNQMIQKYEHQQSYTLRQFEQIQRQKGQSRLFDQMNKKNKILQHNRIINQSNNYQLKHKYFQKLKQLDQYSIKDDEFNRKMKQYQQLIISTKTNINQLQLKQQQYINKNKYIKQTNNAKINFLSTTSPQINIHLQ